MAADQVSQLGYLASGFTASEINQLNLTEIDTVYAIAQYNIYTAEQVKSTTVVLHSVSFSFLLDYSLEVH